jgi:hypothetical protein
MSLTEEPQSEASDEKTGVGGGDPTNATTVGEALVVQNGLHRREEEPGYSSLSSPSAESDGSFFRIDNDWQTERSDENIPDEQGEEKLSMPSILTALEPTKDQLGQNPSANSIALGGTSPTPPREETQTEARDEKTSVVGNPTNATIADEVLGRQDTPPAGQPESNRREEKVALNEDISQSIDGTRPKRGEPNLPSVAEPPATARYTLLGMLLSILTSVWNAIKRLFGCGNDPRVEEALLREEQPENDNIRDLSHNQSINPTNSLQNPDLQQIDSPSRGRGPQ